MVNGVTQSRAPNRKIQIRDFGWENGNFFPSWHRRTFTPSFGEWICRQQEICILFSMFPSTFECWKKQNGGQKNWIDAFCFRNMISSSSYKMIKGHFHSFCHLAWYRRRNFWSHSQIDLCRQVECSDDSELWKGRIRENSPHTNWLEVGKNDPICNHRMHHGATWVGVRARSSIFDSKIRISQKYFPSDNTLYVL